MRYYWDEYKRYFPLAAIGLAFVIIVGVLVTGAGGDDSPKPQVAVKKTTVTVKKVVPTSATGASGATVAVTPQSTEKVSGAHDDPVPILMYHVTKGPPAGTPYPDLWVKPADFKGQMQWLADNGYTGITMAQLFKYWDQGFKLPAKPVVLTFDDGYPSQYKYARPVLAAHHWPGVLFLELSNVGSPDTGLRAYMIKAMIASGWELGSHTITHPDLTTISATQLEQETAGARKAISKKFGVPVDFFCYPAGKYDDTVIAAVKAAGYKGATTELPGKATPDKPFELARVRIDGSDGVDGFASKMQGLDQ
jgi:peptidoglycan/xylan/chitin deacetylase (PgdA/CDA1 family)